MELTLITGRLSKEKRLGLLKALNVGVVDAAQISPNDLLITFFETAEENISFGRGLAQRADNSRPIRGAEGKFCARIEDGIAGEKLVIIDIDVIVMNDDKIGYLQIRDPPKHQQVCTSYTDIG